MSLDCSLDLQRSLSPVQLHADRWSWQGQDFPFPQRCKERTIYYWDGSGFEPVARFDGALIKLVPTDWGAPTFEIDGIKMLPTSKVSPYAYAQRKVALIQPHGKQILDTCGGLGYFAAWCLAGKAAQVLRHLRIRGAARRDDGLGGLTDRGDASYGSQPGCGAGNRVDAAPDHFGKGAWRRSPPPVARCSSGCREPAFVVRRRRFAVASAPCACASVS